MEEAGRVPFRLLFLFLVLLFPPVFAAARGRTQVREEVGIGLYYFFYFRVRGDVLADNRMVL